MKNTYKFELISGEAGNCLALSDEDGGYRFAGPKPWGGGTVRETFYTNLEALLDLRQEINMAIRDLRRKANSEKE